MSAAPAAMPAPAVAAAVAAAMPAAPAAVASTASAAARMVNLTLAGELFLHIGKGKSGINGVEDFFCIRL